MCDWDWWTGFWSETGLGGSSSFWPYFNSCPTAMYITSFEHAWTWNDALLCVNWNAEGHQSFQKPLWYSTRSSPQVLYPTCSFVYHSSVNMRLCIHHPWTHPKCTWMSSVQSAGVPTYSSCSNFRFAKKQKDWKRRWKTNPQVQRYQSGCSHSSKGRKWCSPHSSYRKGQQHIHRMRDFNICIMLLWKSIFVSIANILVYSAKSRLLGLAWTVR